MTKTITAKKFASNVVISIIAQIISLLVSFVTTLIVPKFIDVYQYSYWQSYVLYVSYVGVLHFGLLDGIVLRYSKYDYDELDKVTLRSQFTVLLIFTGIISAIGVSISLFALGGVNKWVFIFVAIGIITKNVFTYNSYMFQITNRINKYVIITITQRVMYGIILAVLLICRVNDFKWYCLADLCGDVIGIFIGVIYNRGLFLGKTVNASKTFKELGANISSGIILLFANWSALLMIGGAKMMTQWRWDELVFGKVSFAFSISNVFLTFVTAISVVLFPSLQRIDRDKLPQMYKSIRSILLPLLFFIILFYFPGCVILNMWLPQYSNSLTYLGVLLPIIIYSSKVSLLTNNYLKVYRKEKRMLVANLISIAVGISLFALCAYVFDNLIALLACVVFTLMLNSVLAEIFVSRIIGANFIKEFIMEAVMTVAFILCASLLDTWIGLAAYLGVYALYGAVNYKSFIELFRNLRKRSVKSVGGEDAHVEIDSDRSDAVQSETEASESDKDAE